MLKLVDNEQTDDILALLQELKAHKENYELMLNDLKENVKTQILLIDPNSRRIHTTNCGAIVGYNVQMAVDS